MTYRLPAALFATVLALGVAAPAFAAPATVAAFDPDKDGTIDLKEAQAAASLRLLEASLIPRVDPGPPEVVSVEVTVDCSSLEAAQ